MEQEDESLNQLVADVLGVALDEISDSTSPDTLSQWDSITHLNLIMAVEEAFDVQMSPEDALELNSVKLLRLYLEEKDGL